MIDLIFVLKSDIFVDVLNLYNCALKKRQHELYKLCLRKDGKDIFVIILKIIDNKSQKKS